MNQAATQKEVATASFSSPDRRTQADRPVIIFDQIPFGPSIGKQTHLQRSPAAARADHRNKPTMIAFAEYVDVSRIKDLWQFLDAQSC